MTNETTEINISLDEILKNISTLYEDTFGDMDKLLGRQKTIQKLPTEQESN